MWLVEKNCSNRKLVIAIDGPAGCGKGTIGFLVGERLGYLFVDTGAMYRAVAWLARQLRIDLSDADRVGELGEASQMQFTRPTSPTAIGYDVFINGIDATVPIRTPDIDIASSLIAQHAQVRRAMVTKQRQLACSGGVVMEGRDICTIVLPNADVKLYITASLEERARRRYEQRLIRGQPADLEAIKAELAERDQNDSQRGIGPLQVAPDAIIVDTSDMTVEESVEEVVRIIRGRFPCVRADTGFHSRVTRGV